MNKYNLSLKITSPIQWVEEKTPSMEGEIKNLLLVWSTALTSLLYCHKVTTITAQGTTRLCTFLPIFCLFSYLPLLLNTVHFSGTTSFFLSLLANLKLLLFAFDKGPLFSNPPLPLSKFILTACVPIKISQNPPQKTHSNGHPSQKGEFKGYPSLQNGEKLDLGGGVGSRKGNKSPLNYFLKLMVLLLLLKIYEYNEHFGPMVKMALFCVHLYVVLDIGLAVVAYLARAMVGVRLEPHFNEPYLATSLQDFWGKRWNLMVTGILHAAVYLPVRSFSGRLLPRRVAVLPAVFASFVVSGLMHELIFYHIGRLRPTWEVTCFFLIHGALVNLEVVVKRSVDGRFRLPAVVSGAAAQGLVMATSFRWFFPPFLRGGVEERSCKEIVAFLEFVVHGRFVGPNDVSCPYFEG